MADYADTDRPEDGSVDPTVGEGLKRFRLTASAGDAQRKSILAAKKFRSGDQWSDAVRIQREGGPALTGVAAQPQRPCLTIDRVSQPVRQVSNTIKNANITASVSPNGGNATKEEAEILKDWMRRVQNDARSEAPIEWAADGAAEGGIGWFRLSTDYVEDAVGEAVFDQDAKLSRILNNLTVYCDPWAKLPTRRDARFLFVTDDMPRDEFKRSYPNAKLSQMDEFRGTGDGDGWATEDTIRVAEYWHCEYDDVRVVQTVDGQIYADTDDPTIPKIPEKLDKKSIKHDRIIQKPRYVCSIINAIEVLKEYEWMGSRIPIFPILGEELNVDGRIVLRGVIQPAMDAQRMVNYTYSAAIETAALEPKSPWVATAAAVGAYKNIWQRANVDNNSWLPWDEYPVDGAMGQKNSAPFRTPAGANIQAFVEMMSRSEEAVKATTGIFDPSLGNFNPNQQSGRAIQALQGQAEHANSNFVTNAQMSVLDLATEMVYIAPKILDRPGRVLSVLGIDENARHVMLGQPFTEGQDGQPQPLIGPDGQPLTADDMQNLQAGMAKFYDLSKGRYGVAVQTGKSFLTRQQEGSAAMGALIPNLPPQMAAAVTPSFIKTLDFPDAEKIAEIAQRTLPPELQGDEQNAPIPPQAQAMIQGLQQQSQQLQQELQKATSGIPAKHIEVQGKLQQAQMDIESRERLAMAQMQSNERIAALTNQTKLLIAGDQIDVQKAKVIAEIDRTLADQATAADKHDAAAAEQGREHAHELGLTHLEHAQSIQKSQIAHDQMVDSANNLTENEGQ